MKARYYVFLSSIACSLEVNDFCLLGQTTAQGGQTVIKQGQVLTVLSPHSLLWDGCRAGHQSPRLAGKHSITRAPRDEVSRYTNTWCWMLATLQLSHQALLGTGQDSGPKHYVRMKPDTSRGGNKS